MQTGQRARGGPKPLSGPMERCSQPGPLCSGARNGDGCPKGRRVSGLLPAREGGAQVNGQQQAPNFLRLGVGDTPVL